MILPALVLLVSAAASNAAPPSLPSPGTKKMAARLQDIIRAGDPMKNPFRNPERAGLIRARLASVTAFEDKLRTRMMLAFELLLSGENEPAVAELLAIRQALSAPPPGAWGTMKRIGLLG